MSMSVPQANSSTTSDWPVRETEWTLRTFLTTPTVSSTGWLIRFSISSGAAPSYSVRTVSVGYERSGSRLTLSPERPIRPNSTIVSVSMPTVTRRRVASSGRLTIRTPAPSRGLRCLRLRGRRRKHRDFGAVANGIAADRDDALAVLEAVAHFDAIALGVAGLDDAALGDEERQHRRLGFSAATASPDLPLDLASLSLASTFFGGAGSITNTALSPSSSTSAERGTTSASWRWS